MKMKLILTITISLLSIFTAQSVLGQFTIKVPFGKKKKEIEKKVEDSRKVEESKPQNSNSDQNTVSETPTKQISNNDDEENAVGNIYFSDKPFPAGGSTEGSKKSFTSSEFIYGRLVLKSGTLRSVFKPSTSEKNPGMFSIGLVLSIDNKAFWSLSHSLIPESDIDKSYWDFDVFPAPETASTVRTVEEFGKSSGPAEDYYQHLTNKYTTEGNYKYIVKISGDRRDFRGNPKAPGVEIKGELNFQFSGADYQKISANLKKLNSDFSVKKADMNPLPKEWTLKSNPLLPGLTIATVNSAYLRTVGTSSGVRVIKTYAYPAGSKTPVIYKNSLGLPVHREFQQWFMVFTKQKDNKCFYRQIIPVQYYAGGGRYSGYGVTWNNDSVPISCSKIGA